ncbi:MAG: helix-turn-helix domain-containing protein [Pirellulaceae bacterium]
MESGTRTHPMNPEIFVGRCLLLQNHGFNVTVIQERTKAGLGAARARGRHGGRPPVTAVEAKVVLAKKLNADKSLDINDICKTLRISRSTFYRYVRM